MVLGLMVGHMQTQHRRTVEGRRSWEATAPDEEPRTYRMDFLTAGGPWNCPGEDFPGCTATRTAMRVHFLHRNVQNNVVILEEGNLPHPR